MMTISNRVSRARNEVPELAGEPYRRELHPTDAPHVSDREVGHDALAPPDR